MGNLKTHVPLQMVSASHIPVTFSPWVSPTESVTILALLLPIPVYAQEHPWVEEEAFPSST